MKRHLFLLLWFMLSSLCSGQTLNVGNIYKIATSSLAPNITTDLTNVTFTIGDLTNINIVAEGAEPLIYRWYTNTTTPALLSSTSNRIAWTYIDTTNAASYWVTVSNAYGTDISATNTVTVSAGGTAFFSEDFEDGSVGYDGNNANAWEEENTPNPKYIPALVGTQSYNSTADGKRSHAHITSSTELWLTYDLKFVTLTAGAGWTGVTDDAGTRLRWEFTGVGNKIWAVQGTGHGATTAGELVEGTVYHFKQHWKNDGTASVEFTTTTWQGSEDNYVFVDNLHIY